MPEKHFALWFLNRVAHTEWDHDGMRDVLRGGFMGIGANDVVFGQRPDQSKPGVLMYEEEDHDEYFIPIPVKCIGDPDSIGIPASIRNFYKQYFGPGDLNWREYWKPDEKSVFPNVKMVSAAGVGYYKILQDFTKKGYRNILIGYSQGGLVARYLAFLDEYVGGGDGVIDGIITIESPNFGSPLGRPANASNVLQSLNLVIAGFGQLDAASFPITAAKLKLLTGAPRELDIRFVLDLLDTPLTEFRTMGASLMSKNQKLFKYLETARKWLSGLDDTGHDPVFEHAESAFFDLNIEFLAQPGSVLHDVNKNPLRRIKHAAIIGTDNQLDMFVESGVRSFVSTLAPVKAFLANHLAPWGHIEQKLRQLLTIAGDAYKGAMSEQGAGLNNPDIAARINDFNNGVKAPNAKYDLRNGELQAQAHDFVIPSAYQLIEKQPGAPFLGNWVNPDASHLSGADPNQAGKQTQNYIMQILEQMR